MGQHLPGDVPGDAALEDEQDASEGGAVVDTGPAALRFGRLFGQQRLDHFPQSIGEEFFSHTSPYPPPGFVRRTKLALRSVARRYRLLAEEIAELDEQLDRLVAEAAPALVALKGVGTDTAASLLVAAGDNPERLRSEAAFAHLCGVAPIPASSGKVRRHRLNRCGNRDANRALYVLALGRMRWDERTRDYVARRTAEGKTKPEIIRCLKRFMVREVYSVLAAGPPPASRPQAHDSSLGP